MKASRVSAVSTDRSQQLSAIGNTATVTGGYVNALNAAFPTLGRQLPFVELAGQATALERADHLGEAIGCDQLFLKRDDVSGGIYGGNKVRKLEYLLGEALASRCEAVVTFGSAGSNHALATAIYARQIGLPCTAILTDQEANPSVAWTLRYLAWAGATIVPASHFGDVKVLANDVHRWYGAGKVYEIPFGGSSWLGTVGFVAAGLELAAQLSALRVPGPDRIYVPCGTLGTAVGLALGLRLARLGSIVVAVKSIPRQHLTRDMLARFLANVNRKLNERDPSVPIVDATDRNFEVREEFAGYKYGLSTPECDEAVLLARERGGLHLDVSYSAKAFACIIADARSGKINRERVMLWLTYNAKPSPAEIGSITTENIPHEFQKFFL